MSLDIVSICSDLCRMRFTICLPKFRELQLCVTTLLVVQFALAQTQTGTGSAKPPCYDLCDDTVLYAESIGYNPNLCGPQTTFFDKARGCLNCLNNATIKDTYTIFGQEIVSFVDYCKGLKSISTNESKFIQNS